VGGEKYSSVESLRDVDRRQTGNAESRLITPSCLGTMADDREPEHNSRLRKRGAAQRQRVQLLLKTHDGSSWLCP